MSGEECGCGLRARTPGKLDGCQETAGRRGQERDGVGGGKLEGGPQASSEGSILPPSTEPVAGAGGG